MTLLLALFMLVASSAIAGDAGHDSNAENGTIFYTKAMAHFNELGRYPDGLVLACRYFKKSSDLGYPKSYHHTANCYSYGFLGEQGNINYIDAEKYWQKSVDSLGDAPSKIALAKSFLHMPSRQEKYQQAVSLLKGAEDIDGQVEFLLCDVLLTGKGVSPNPERGFNCLLTLAKDGNSVAQGALYYIFSNGLFGLPVDNNRAGVWWGRYEANSGKYISDSSEFIQYLKERCLFVPLGECTAWE